nr:apolipoprotein N-acyltransferase [Octadecabacter dasysiphoniae]
MRTPAGSVPFWIKVARVIAPVLLGLFLARAHDDTIFGPFHILIGLILILMLMPLDRPKKMALFGWLVGLGYFGWTLRWIVEPFLVDVARHGWMAPFAIALMAGGLALFWAAAFGVARRIGGQSGAVLWMPVTLTAAELARGHVFSGFPWGIPSYALVGTGADVWLAWVGSYGALFVLSVVAVAVVYGLTRGWLIAAPVIGAVVLVTMSLVGLTPLASATTGQTVRLIQPNAPQHQKWDRDWMPVFFDRAIAQTGAGDAVDVVIWPETSVPAVLDYADPWLEQMSLAARGAPVVAGIQRRDQGEYFNSAILIEGPSTVAAISDKAHLVPFGEYIPLAWLLEPLGLGTLVEQVAGFSPGTGDGLMEVDGLGTARVLICYEGIFPEDMQRGEVRADILLIITNDAWFGNNAGPRQHLVQAQARAIEQGLPVVRAANTGISAVIDARGRIVASLALNTAGYLDAMVPAPLPPTLYARIGDWPLVVLLIVALAAGVAQARRNKIDAGTSRG